MKRISLIVLLTLSVAYVSAGVSPGPDQLATNTWSLVAADVDRGEVGIALATCVPAQVSVSASKVTLTTRETEVGTYSAVAGVRGGSSFELARLTAGVGAVVAQGLVDNGNARRLHLATAELVAGAPADRILQVLTANDPRFEERQYGVVTLTPGVTSFTGSAALEWAGFLSAEGVSVQGNLLVGPEVVEEALRAFQAVRSSPKATLGDALMAGLEAGSAMGGDKRCPKEQSALTAFITVVRSDDTAEVPHLWLATQPQERGGENPVKLLRAAYDDMQAILDATPPGGDGAPPGALWISVLIVPLLAGFLLWITLRKRRRDS